MDFIVHYKANFSKEFKQFPRDQQDSILDFILTYEENGLIDFKKYKGKISCSWSNLDENSQKYKYAKDNDLWHYHIGIPKYIKKHEKYETSDYVLHFQWIGKGNEISLIDVYKHYDIKGNFYLPNESYLKD